MLGSSLFAFHELVPVFGHPRRSNNKREHAVARCLTSVIHLMAG